MQFRNIQSCTEKEMIILHCSFAPPIVCIFQHFNGFLQKYSTVQCSPCNDGFTLDQLILGLGWVGLMIDWLFVIAATRFPDIVTKTSMHIVGTTVCRYNRNTLDRALTAVYKLVTRTKTPNFPTGPRNKKENVFTEQASSRPGNIVRRMPQRVIVWMPEYRGVRWLQGTIVCDV